MATLVEELPKEEEAVFDTLDEATPAEAVVAQPEEVVEPVEDEELPEKYSGKSTADIVRMHQEAERQMGRQSGEVGELRKIVDNFIQGQVESQTAPNADEEINFFDDPEAAVARAVDNHPSVKAAAKTEKEFTHQQALSVIQQKHPDIGTIFKGEDFGKWVTGSDYRMRLYTQADQNYDYQAADDLLTMFKEQPQLTQKLWMLRRLGERLQLSRPVLATPEGQQSVVQRKYIDVLTLLNS